MAYQKQITASIGSNIEPEIVKPVALFHHSHRIVKGVDNLLQVSHLKIASNMVSSEVSIISRIN